MAETPRRVTGRPDKRSQVVAAAQRVFGRMGYAQAGMDLVAAEASVSTRTIYKHFATKEELFATVLEESATMVADDFIRELPDAEATAEPQALLTSVGHAYLRHLDDHPGHFAMVQQIRAGALELPDSVIQRWHHAGPDRILNDVIRVLSAMIDRGQLRAEPPRLIALHFVALILAPRAVHPYGSAPLAISADETVDSAVSTLLRGYGER